MTLNTKWYVQGLDIRCLGVNSSNEYQACAKNNIGWVLVFQGLFPSLAIFLLLNSFLSMHILLTQT